MQFQNYNRSLNQHQPINYPPSQHQIQQNYLPIPTNINKNQPINIQNRSIGNYRPANVQFNGKQQPQLLEKGRSLNNTYGNNLYPSLNNGIISHPNNQPNHPFISQISKNKDLKPNFINNQQIVHPLSNPPGQISSHFGNHPSPAFIGVRTNLSHPQPYIPIRPTNTSTATSQTLINIQQTKIHCVICQTNYSQSQRQQHLKKHQRPKYNQQNNNIKKIMIQYKKHHQYPQMRPIVQPQQYNIQYNPNSFVLEKQTCFSTPDIIIPSYHDYAVGTTDLDIIEKPVQVIVNQPVQIIVNDPVQVIVNQPAVLHVQQTNIKVLSSPPVMQPSIQFSRQIQISDPRTSEIQPTQRKAQPQIIETQNFNNHVTPNPVIQTVHEPIHQKPLLHEQQYVQLKNNNQIQTYPIYVSNQYQTNHQPAPQSSNVPTQAIQNKQQPHFLNEPVISDSRSNPQSSLYQPTNSNNNNQIATNNFVDQPSGSQNHNEPFTPNESFQILQQNTQDFHKRKRMPKSFGGLNQ